MKFKLLSASALLLLPFIWSLHFSDSKGQIVHHQQASSTIKKVWLKPGQPFLLTGLETSSYVFYGSGQIKGGGTVITDSETKFPAFTVLGDHITLDNINFHYKRLSGKDNMSRLQVRKPCVLVLGSHVSIKNSRFKGCPVGIMAHGPHFMIDRNRFDLTAPQSPSLLSKKMREEPDGVAWGT